MENNEVKQTAESGGSPLNDGLYMNIYAKEGDKIVFLGSDEEVNKWGSCDNPNDLLVIGDTYTVDHTEVHSWYTKVFLKEVGGGFNSVLFDNV